MNLRRPLKKSEIKQQDAIDRFEEKMTWGDLTRKQQDAIDRYFEALDKYIGIKYSEDCIVNSVIDKFIERSNAGMRKYNKTLEENTMATLDWINAAQEEAMDFILYLERLKKEFE